MCSCAYKGLTPFTVAALFGSTYRGAETVAYRSSLLKFVGFIFLLKL